MPLPVDVTSFEMLENQGLQTMKKISGRAGNKIVCRIVEGHVG
jgi:hypothetical protein